MSNCILVLRENLAGSSTFIGRLHTKSRQVTQFARFTHERGNGTYPVLFACIIARSARNRPPKNKANDIVLFLCGRFRRALRNNTCIKVR